MAFSRLWLTPGPPLPLIAKLRCIAEIQAEFLCDGKV
jgi:hypothetical protein